MAFLSSLFSNNIKSTEQPKSSLTKSQQHDGVIWVDVHDPIKETLDHLAVQFKLQSQHIEHCLQRTQIAQTDATDRYIFLLFDFPFLAKDRNCITNSQVNVFLGKDFIITIHDSANRHIVDRLFQEYQDNQVQMPKTPGRILYNFLHYLLKDTIELTNQSLDEIADIEEKVFNNRKGSQAKQIGEFRRKIIKLKSIVTSQHLVLEDMEQTINAFSGEDLGWDYGNNVKISRRLLENINEAEQTIEIYKDADFITSTEQTNLILAALTLLFTLTIPATVIGALYGMNVLIPGGIEAGSWTFLGEYTTFKLIIFTSISLALLMYLYFRLKKWF